MKILFLIYHVLVPHSGISKKILSQVEGLRENGAEVSLCALTLNPDGSKSRTVDGKSIMDFGFGLKAKLRKRISYSDITDYVRDNGFNAVYIRYDINADPFTVKFVRSLKKAGIRVIAEIPTYPYDGEFKGLGLAMNFQLFVDKCFRKRFFRHCNRALVYSDNEYVFGCRTVSISNGVNFGNIPLANVSDYDGTLRMLSVANVHLWHGLDRLIAGMAGSPGIKSELHIVGDGVESIFEEYRSLVRQYGLEDRVKISGPMFGHELDKEFDWCNIAVGSLARHRSGITDIKTLKNREYAARGRAFFYSEHDSDFEGRPYIFKVPANETPVDMKALEEFRRSLSLSPEQIRESVQDLSWTRQMGKVISFLSEEVCRKA